MYIDRDIGYRINKQGGFTWQRNLETIVIEVNLETIVIEVIDTIVSLKSLSNCATVFIG